MSKENLPIRYGCRVRMHYAMTLPDGTEIVSTYDDAPLDFTLGDGTMEPPLEASLIGLRPGEEQTLQVSGDEIYGAIDQDNLRWLDRGDFPPQMALEIGHIVGFTTPEGEEVAGSISSLEPSRVRVDFNHPLSGRRFNFKVSILSVTPGA